MNQTLYLLAAALIGSQLLVAQAAQPANNYSLTVDLAVTGDNPALKSEILRELLQEVRALHRGVTITAVHPDYRLRVATISLGDRGAPAGGFAVSYTYSRLEKVPDDILGPTPDRELLRAGLAMLTGAKGDERAVCRKIAAVFDAAELKDARGMLDSMRQVLEGKK